MKNCSVLYHRPLNHRWLKSGSKSHSLHILSQNLITNYLNLFSPSFFFLLQPPPHRSFPGSCLLLFNFLFLTLSGLVSCVKGNVTVSCIFFFFSATATSLVSHSFSMFLHHVSSLHFFFFYDFELYLVALIPPPAPVFFAMHRSKQLVIVLYLYMCSGITCRNAPTFVCL